MASAAWEVWVQPSVSMRALHRPANERVNHSQDVRVGRGGVVEGLVAADRRPLDAAVAISGRVGAIHTRDTAQLGAWGGGSRIAAERCARRALDLHSEARRRAPASAFLRVHPRGRLVPVEARRRAALPEEVDKRGEVGGWNQTTLDDVPVRFEKGGFGRAETIGHPRALGVGVVLGAVVARLSNSVIGASWGGRLEQNVPARLEVAQDGLKD